MKVLIAPNSMKGSLSAFDFANTVEEAFIACSPEFETIKVPVADGGDFTGAVLKKHMKATEITTEVKNPFGKIISSKYAVSGDTSIIEMADASGMKLVDARELNPLKASSYGTGQLIQDALTKGCSEVLLAIGGSATVDGGMGMMQALGYQFFDSEMNVLEGKGGSLSKVKSILPMDKYKDVVFKIICDVNNPLLGINGAAAVFGPQKGATPEMVRELEKGLSNWVQLLEKESGRQLANNKGAGAAGGLSVPLMAYFNAEIMPGADFILEQLNIEEKIKWADLVITGEGKIDSQTGNNKAPSVVAKLAKKYGKRVVAIGGSVEEEGHKIFDEVHSLVGDGMSGEYAMLHAKELVYKLSVKLAKSKLRND